MRKLNQEEVENQLNKNIKILKSDQGGEYESNDFSKKNEHNISKFDNHVYMNICYFWFMNQKSVGTTFQGIAMNM